MSNEMTREVEIAEFVKARDAALKTLDMDYARKSLPTASDEVILCAMHKARYEIVTMPDELRLASGEWLKERGYKRMHGIEFESELPT